jgi:hypothetical protein
LKKLALIAALAIAGPALAGCNAIVLTTALTSTSLAATKVSGSLTSAPTNARVGYITWIELMQDGSVQGKLNFDLVRDKTVPFDKAVQPANNKFELEITPKPNVAEGTYVVFAWDDVNGNGIFEGDQGEKRAPEVYRVRGQAANRGLWTTEKFVFTDKKLAIEYADQNGGLAFTFQ